MLIKFAVSATILFGMTFSCFAQEAKETKAPKPIELEVLKETVGVWDAKAEVWPQGLDSPSFKFDGVETNQLYGEHWIASDSEYSGLKLHSIIGYDLDKKKMVGMVVDHGPYSASMTGDYDKESKTITWITKAKDENGNPMTQKTTITQKSADERVLILSVPGEKENEFVKSMQIRFVKRK